MIQEIVLPNSKFAQVRPITVADMMAAFDKDPWTMAVNLVGRLATVEDRPLSTEDILRMELVDFRPIFQLIHDNMVRAQKLTRGVA